MDTIITIFIIIIYQPHALYVTETFVLVFTHFASETM